MSYSIRPLNMAERKYTYAQSTQISGQTGMIGCLRGDFGTGGEQFFTTFFDERANLKTDEFIRDLDDVINGLRFGENKLLKSRSDMAHAGRNEPESAMKGNYTTEYGFRADTSSYAFLLRCNPTKGDYNFYCFCYRKEWLDAHIERADRDIRFIRSDYTELFRLPDGEKLVVTHADGNRQEKTCRYIDDCHVEIENRIYHICEFAECMEGINAVYEPKEKEYLPRECLSTLPSSGELISITRYRKGYTPKSVQNSPEENRDMADRINMHNGISRAQEAAMLAGSMFGWDTPSANPKNYDSDGRPIRTKEKER